MRQEKVGRDVTHVRKGQFVIGSFFASDGTCPICRREFGATDERRAIKALLLPTADSPR